MTKVLDDDAIAAAMGPLDLRPALREALKRFAAGAIEVAPRSSVGFGRLGRVTQIMLARDDERAVVVSKLIDYDPERPQRDDRPSHLGLVTLLVDGKVALVCSATAFTAIRTAATTALAVDLLAAAGARTLAIVGAGQVARQLAYQVARVRALDEIRVTSRTNASAERLAAALRDELHGRAVVSSADVRTACDGADIVACATTAVDPILFGGDVRGGTLIAAIGSGIPARRELDGAVVGQAQRVVVEDLATAWEEAGDLITAADEGHVRRGAGTPLATLLDHPQAVGPDELVIFKSVGMAWEDMACASAVVRAVQPHPR